MSTSRKRTGPLSFKTNKRAKIESASKIVSASTVNRPTTKVEVKRKHDSIGNVGGTSYVYLQRFGVVDDGDASNDRDGRAIKQLATELNVHVSTQDDVRIIIFKWKNALSTPNVGEILFDIATHAGLAGYNVDWAGSYTILSDRWLKTDGAPNHTHRWTVKHPFIQTYFGTGATEVADMNLYYIAISVAPTTDLPAILGTTSTSFVDI